jgi:hypothetical protein
MPMMTMHPYFVSGSSVRRRCLTRFAIHVLVKVDMHAFDIHTIVVLRIFCLSIIRPILVLLMFDLKIAHDWYF